MIAQVLPIFVESKKENDFSTTHQVKKRLLLRSLKVYLFDYLVHEIVAQLVEQ